MLAVPPLFYLMATSCTPGQPPPPYLVPLSVSTQICGYEVPTGCIVALPPFAMDVNTAVFGPDAEEFKPERCELCVDG